MRKKVKYEKYVGKTINNLTILEVIHKHDDRYCYWFKCRCVCGKEKEIRAINVVNNVIKSCGCLRYDYRRSKECLENARQMGLKNRKHIEKCDYCGFENHYAKGLCKNCYCRLKRNGYLEYLKEHKRGNNDR